MIFVHSPQLFRLIREVWDHSDFTHRQKLQNLLFSKGIRYNKRADDCRTPDIEKVFGWTALKQCEMEIKEKGNSPIFMKNSPLVAKPGFEPGTSGL